jgi:hypothetical protein
MNGENNMDLTRKEINMKRIVTGKSRTPSMLLVPTVFYSHYHNCGEKIVDIGIAFLRCAYGISIAIKPKNKP